MGRAAGYEGVLPSIAGSFEQLSPAQVSEIAAWVAERRTADGPFEIVMEGTTPGGDAEAARAQLEPYDEAVHVLLEGNTLTRNRDAVDVETIEQESRV